MLSTGQTTLLTPRDVTMGLGLASGTTTAILDALTGQELLRRVSNPADRRGSLLEPTATGRRLAETVRAAYETVLARAVPVPQRVSLTAHLRQLTQALAEQA